MSDVSQGEGWWQASDGKWYAPELHPDYVAPVPGPEPEPAPPAAAEPAPAPASALLPEPEAAGEAPTEAVAATPFAAPDATTAIPSAADVTGAMPTTAVGPPPGEPPITTVGAPPPVTPSGGGKGKLIAAIVIVLALIGGGIAFALSRGDDNKTSTAKSDQSSASDSSDSSSSTSKSSSTSTDALIAKAKKSLLTPSDVSSGPSAGFVATAAPSSGELPCTGDNPDDTTKPAGTASTELDHDDDISITERIRVYKSEADAKKVFTVVKDGFDCKASIDGTLEFQGSPSSNHLKGADDDFSVDALYAPGSGTNLHENGSSSSSNLLGTDSLSTDSPSTDSLSTDSLSSDTLSSSSQEYLGFYIVRVGQSVISITYRATAAADTTKLDSREAITETAIKKFA